MHTRIMTLGLVLGIAGSATAQDAPPLSGPAVETQAEAPSLIERDFAGTLRPLEARAEFAAVRLLGLSAEELVPVEAIIEARGAEVEAIVFDNLLLLTELQTARSNAGGGGDFLGGDAELRGRMMRAIAPLIQGEPLVDRVAAALPEDSREPYRALVDEWYEAQAAEAPPRGMPGDRAVRGNRDRRGDRGEMNSENGARGAGRPERTGGARFARRIAELQAVGLEVKNAYERGSAGRTADLEAALEAMHLTPEQEGEVRRILTAVFVENGGKPTEAQRSEAFREVFELLTPEQRREVLKTFRR